MKTNLLTCISLLFIVMISFAQNRSRIEVQGQIIIDSSDLEGVTVYNSSSNKGTITDAKGIFAIKVAVNDRIEVSALQFEKFEVTISQDILDAKSMTIFLVERINTLDEIYILPFGLSGNLTFDLDRTQPIQPNLDALYFGLAHPENFEFVDDYKTEVRNVAMEESNLVYTTNFVAIAGLLKAVFTASSYKKRGNELDDKSVIKTISSKYSTEYLLERLDIKKTEIEAFLSFVEREVYDVKLLDDGREFEFLDFIIAKSVAFKKLKHGKH
ncbi:MAG: carboxypeptidase-like regulatory domain-containing protein [Flavobacteriaceae bacterium]|nr:carboxypeptidase-like regulatory domain-containing protein [Flavobacteriaceae bacterium]